MKQRQNPLEFSLTSHQFILTPHRFESTQRLEGLYHLQLEKGCQRMAEVKEVMQFQKAREFVFRDKQRFTVRGFKQKSMVFSWSIYKYVDGALQFVDLLKLDLNEFYSKYINEIKNMGIQYAKILEYKNTNREYMARAWIQMRKHLRSHYFFKEIKNSTETFGLLVLIQIQNELDRLTELQVEKWKVTKKVTLKNQKNQEQTDVKSHSSIKLESGENSDELELKKKSKEEQDDHKEQQEGIMCLPINQLKIKNWAVLSDIIEASNEQSHMHGERTERDIRTSEGNNPNTKKSLLKTKTYHFVGDSEFESAQFRRNNSLQAIKTGSKVDLEDHKEDAKVNQDEFTATSSIIKLQLNSKIDDKPNSNSKMRFFVLATFVFFLLIIFPAASIINRSLSLNKQMLGNNKKIKKQRFF